MNFCPQILPSTYPPVVRLIVIGDLHGDWMALRDCLKLARVVNPQGNWIGGSTYVVQLGDILDRGCRVDFCTDENSEFKILKYLQKLHQQAQKKGGAVLVLLGNHELMNVMGDFRYVSPMGLRHFGSPGRRKKALQPGGPWARHLACQTNSIIQVGSWIFSHTGPLPEITYQYSIPEINRIVREFLLGNLKVKDLQSKPEIWNFFLHRKYGYPETNHQQQCSRVKKSVNSYKGKYLAVGHTPQGFGINSDCQGQLWRIDTGMSGAFGPRTNLDTQRRIQVLEILNDGQKIRILQ